MDILAHRGFSGHFPENTLTAFKAMLDYPIQGVELDVQLSQDDQLVVFHDFTLNRTTGMNGHIHTCSWKRLQQLEMGCWFDRRFHGEPIPLLSEVLDLLPAAPFLINLELKIPFSNASIGHRMANALAALLPQFPDHKLILSSFSHHALATAHQALPSASLGLLSSADLIRVQDAMSAIAPLEDFESYHPEKNFISGETIRQIHQMGKKVLSWTVNEQQDALALQNLGIDGIITNYPNLAVEWLKK